MMNDATTDEHSYEEDWRLYYAQRRDIIRRLAQCAAGATIVLSLLAMVPDATQASLPTAMNVLGVMAGLLLFATVAQWFRFMWTLGGWICPRCREPFFHSTFVRNPFGRFCRHCNLRRLASSEIGDMQHR